MNRILVYHPTGNQNVRALIKGLCDNHILHSFHTTVAVFSNSFYYSLLKGPLEKFKRRTYDNMLKKYVVQYPVLELSMLAGLKKYKGFLLNGSSVNKILAYDVAKYLDKKYNDVDGIFGYPFGSEPIFVEAKKYGIKCIYEQTTAYYRSLKQITMNEKLENKNWAESISIYEEPQDILDKLDRELDMADFVIAASSYIKRTLIEGGVKEDKIKIVPYGFPKVNPKEYRKLNNGDKIKVLFAGNISQLKGLSYLSDAIKGLEKYIDLTIIGPFSEKNEQIKEFINSHEYLGSLPHDELLCKMHEHDVFIFPSLCDGWGMVVSEAMSQGVPVIATMNSCGPDIIRHKENGWLVPIRDSKSIHEILKDIISNPGLIQNMGENAIETAKSRPWSVYEKEISHFLEQS